MFIMQEGVQQLVDTLEAGCLPTVDESRFYGWQPLPLLDFYREGMEIVGPGRGRFLDVGSGIGSKLALAAALGWDVQGLELRAEFADVSQQLFPQFPVTVDNAFDFDGYDQFDLIYSYRPCVDPHEQDALNRVIADRMAPNALFFSAGGPWPYWLEYVGGQVWRTHS